MKVKIR